MKEELKQDLITVSELSTIFDLKKGYIYKMIHNRKIIYYKPFGKKVYFRLSEVIENFQNSKVDINHSQQIIKDLADKHMMR
jgi:excisionase family DNA binding protein